MHLLYEQDTITVVSPKAYPLRTQISSFWDLSIFVVACLIHLGLLGILSRNVVSSSLRFLLFVLGFYPFLKQPCGSPFLILRTPMGCPVPCFWSSIRLFAKSRRGLEGQASGFPSTPLRPSTLFQPLASIYQASFCPKVETPDP
ncbi:hypothetical protein NPIL_133471 [Nephila pilipes]|uniref:Uncharacterized protein n=1 Tax=Nephila pilipes TaxID=299642 RepID=A0A8X6MX94_NEPPI|nr:hypothetical protein NPIL_133471 [Nephila pilipes]